MNNRLNKFAPFENDESAASEAEGFLSSNPSFGELSGLYRDLARRYDDLLSRHQRIIRIGDLQQARMQMTNHALNDLADQMQSQVLHVNQELSDRENHIHSTSRFVTIGEVAGGVAHDLSNPITVIAYRAESLRTKIAREEVPQEVIIQDLDLIIRMNNRITSIVTTIKNLAREGNRDPFEAVELSSIIKDAVEVCKYRFETTNVLLKISNLDSTRTIECRPVQIFQAILNLLNNAHDAVENLSERWVQLNVEWGTSEVVLSVIDSGVSLSISNDAKMPKLFSTTKIRGKGTGLGLSIIQRAVSDHQGSFELDAKSANTKFVITLPVSQPEEKSKKSSS